MTPFDVRSFDPPLTVPELSSGPVVLRPYDRTDLPLIRLASADPYIPTITSIPAVYTDAEGTAFIARQHERALSGHGLSFVITERGDASVGVGSIGLWLREIESGRASIGYWLLAGARGRHLAGWALRGLVSYAFASLSIPRLHLFVEPWNAASVRTAEFAGFSREAFLRGWEHIDGEQHDVDCYVLLREEWSAGE